MEENDVFRRISSEIVNAASQMADLLGLSDAMARIAGLVFASPEPMSPAEICRELSITKGTASVYIRLLEEKGIIRQTQAPVGRRGKFYCANPDLLEDLKKQVLERSRKRLQILQGATGRIETLLDTALASESAETRKQAVVIEERLSDVRLIHGSVQTLLEALVSGSGLFSPSAGEAAKKSRPRKIPLE